MDKLNSQIVIKTNGRKAEIFVNGKKIDGVTGYRMLHSTKENEGLPRLQIDLKATNVTLETDTIPELPEPFKQFYVQSKDRISM